MLGKGIVLSNVLWEFPFQQKNAARSDCLSSLTFCILKVNMLDKALAGHLTCSRSLPMEPSGPLPMLLYLVISHIISLLSVRFGTDNQKYFLNQNVKPRSNQKLYSSFLDYTVTRLYPGWQKTCVFQVLFRETSKDFRSWIRAGSQLSGQSFIISKFWFVSSISKFWQKLTIVPSKSMIIHVFCPCKFSQHSSQEVSLIWQISFTR